MEPRLSSVLERNPQEEEILGHLLGMYAEESQVYRRILELSHKQGQIISDGGNLTDIRRLLEQKKNCLEIIGRLEMAQQRTKSEWEKGRNRWSAGAKVRLNSALHDVSDLIEEILACEEKNDMDLIEQAGVGQ